jgi:hypothetical protein
VVGFCRVLELSTELRLQPRLVLQTFCIDESWIFGGPKSSAIKSISKPHVFYIVQETVAVSADKPEGPKEEVIVMYTRFLARSFTDREVHHRPEWATVRGGPWTSRVVLMKLTDVPLIDPNRQPALPVKTSEIYKCLRQHRKEHNLTQAQYDQFEERLQRFEAVGETVDQGCADCKSLTDQIIAIGTISRKVDATEAQLKLANEQTARKLALRTALRTHLYGAKHSDLKLNGWWSKWRDRVARIIRPYYLQRNLIVDLRPHHALLTGRSVHPDELPREASDPPITRLRVDERWERQHGLPKLGHFVVTRGQSPLQPMWIGKVISCFDAEMETDEDFREPRPRSDSSKHPTAAAAAASSSIAAAAAPATRASTRSTRAQTFKDADEEDEEEPNSSSEREEEEEFEPEEEEEESEASTGPADMLMNTDDEEDEPVPEPIPKPTANKRGKKRKSSFTSQKKKNTAAAASSSGNSKSSRSAKARRTSGPAATSLSSSAASNLQTAAAAAASASSSTSSTAAAAAASSSSSSSSVGPSWRVQWYEFQDNTAAKRVDPLNEKKTIKMMEGQSIADFQLWTEAQELFAQGHFGRLPKAIVERWKDLSYLPTGELGTVNRAQLIVWGPNVLTKSGLLSAVAFPRVVEDLCETQDLAIGFAIDYTAEAASLARRGRENEEEADESKEEGP